MKIVAVREGHTLPTETVGPDTLAAPAHREKAATSSTSIASIRDVRRLVRVAIIYGGLRLVLGLILALPWTALAVEAQQTGTVWRVGVLMPDRPGALEAVLEGLRDFNYIPGRNVILETRRASTQERFPRLAAELVGLNPHVIIAVSGGAARALKAATNTIPIVMASSGDAVSDGLVASLARPGGNVTGLTFISPDLTAKRLQILKEVAPGAGRIGVIGCRSDTAVMKAQRSEVQSAARRMGLQLMPFMPATPEELSRSFERAQQEKMDAILVLDCPRLPPQHVATVVRTSRLPALYPYPRYVQAGGLMSYGPNSEREYRRAATFVHKILQGAKPAELPVEQPTSFELVINLKTAKALALTIPPSLLLRADHVIE